MSEYSSVCIFGGLAFSLSDISLSYQPSSLKTNIGMSLVEKQIPLRNTKDTILTIKGVITGLSQSYGQSLAVAIENDRASLITLNDGYFHTYSDGKHSFNAVIRPGSLKWNDEANRETGNSYKFTMEVIEWQ